LAEGLDGPSGLARLAQVCDRWVYSACLCFALTQEQQQQSRFSYAYSSYQLEYSRNLLFKSGRQLDEVYQGLIDRTRRLLDVPRLKTIMRAVAEAVVALASSPGGFTAKELAARVRAQQGRSMAGIIHPLDAHYQTLQREMLATLQTLKLAA
jgi:hypothetical protein